MMSCLFNYLKIPNIGRRRLLFTFLIFLLKGCIAYLLSKISVAVMFKLAYLRNVKEVRATFDKTTCNHYFG